MAGSTTFSSSASFMSSCPASRTKGKAGCTAAAAAARRRGRARGRRGSDGWGGSGHGVYTSGKGTAAATWVHHAPSSWPSASPALLRPPRRRAPGDAAAAPAAAAPPAAAWPAAACAAGRWGTSRVWPARGLPGWAGFGSRCPTAWCKLGPPRCTLGLQLRLERVATYLQRDGATECRAPPG